VTIAHGDNKSKNTSAKNRLAKDIERCVYIDTNITDQPFFINAK